ncbi:hypothetical protein Tco_0710526 [Tanacetum coccineum]
MVWVIYRRDRSWVGRVDMSSWNGSHRCGEWTNGTSKGSWAGGLDIWCLGWLLENIVSNKVLRGVEKGVGRGIIRSYNLLPKEMTWARQVLIKGNIERYLNSHCFIVKHYRSLIFNLELVPSCLTNCDLEPLSLDLDLNEIINLASSLDHLCNTLPSCDLVSLDQQARTLCHLEIHLTISLDNL